METFKIDFDGENGVDKLFNEYGKHTQDDTLKLVPFTTTKDKTGFSDFTGVVGSFSRFIDNKKFKSNFDVEKFYEKLNGLVSCEDEEKVIDMIKTLFIKDGRIVPFNIKSMNYINANNDNDKIAFFLYSMFVTDEVKGHYMDACDKEESNVLQKLVFEAMPVLKAESNIGGDKYDCFLPYVKESFQKDLIYMLSKPEMYKKNLKRFLEYYFMFYVTQLVIKLSKFENAEANVVEKIYMTLSWEVTTKTRHAYEYGWRYVKEFIPKLFTHAVTLEFIAHNNQECNMDYIQVYQKISETNDEEVSEQICAITDKYRKWISNVDYTMCVHDSKKDGESKTLNEIRYLFEIIDYQFNNGTRKAAYGRYSARFIEFVQSNFGKRRGASGYTFNITEQDIILFTQIVLGQNEGRIRLVTLFEEFEKRGLIFDRDSKKKIVELYEKLNLLEKKSDSGDAQYVKSIL